MRNTLVIWTGPQGSRNSTSPRFDGKTDPMLFINKCESYFRQQRTMPEERVWMASYNLEDVAQLWYIQL